MSEEEKVVSGETLRRRRRLRNPWIRLFKRLLVLGAIIAVVVAVWKNWDRIAPESVLDWFDEQFGSVESGDGFPTPISGSSVVSFGETGSHLAVLSDTSLRFLSRTASCVAERTHGFSHPVMQTAGNYVLVTDIGGEQYRLETRRGTQCEKLLENREVFASDLLSNGTVAVILGGNSQSYLSEVQVFSADGTLKHTYQCTKYLLTAVSLMPSGKGVAAVGTTAEGGALKSVLLVWKYGDKEPKEYVGDDVLLYEVTCFNGGAILAVGDTEVWYRSGSSEPARIPYEGKALAGYAASRQTAGLALRRDGGAGMCCAWVFGRGGSHWESEDLAGVDFRHISCDGRQVSLLTDSMLYTFNGNGETAHREVGSDGLQSAAFRSRLMLLTLGSLDWAENS